MIKTFIKHQVLEKCIDIAFDGIARAFKKPDIDLRIVRFEELAGEDGTCKFCLGVMKGGKRYDLTISVPGNMKQNLMRTQGKNSKEIRDLFLSMAMEEMEREIKLRDMGPKRYFKEEFGIDVSDDYESEYIFDGAEVDAEQIVNHK